MTDLFSSMTLGGLALPNRMAMAPMTRNRAPGTIPTALMVEYYTQRASAGLIVTEGAQISDAGIGYPATPGIHSSEQVTAWKAITDAVHAKGGHIFCQLWYCGRISHPDLLGGAQPVSASTVRPEGQAVTYTGMQDFVTPRALEMGEIPGIVAEYRHAARAAMAAGFDGVEVHGANGYLPDQFLRDGSNHRTDVYGGSIDNRARFLLEITDAVCAEVGVERVGVRISPVNGFNSMHDSDPQALFNHVAESLGSLGIAYLHVVEVSMTGEPDGRVDMDQLRKRFNGMYIANGRYDKSRGMDAVASGHADMVAYGIPFLANPDLPERFRRDAPLNEPDPTSFYGGDAHGYTDYPALTD